MCSTQLFFLNHASMVVRYGDHYLLTDPWYQAPAYHSWLPVPPPAIHPAYLASLKGNLSILISHAHDDHLDAPLLSLFDKDTPFVSSSFSVVGPFPFLRENGFTNLIDVSAQGAQIGPFFVSSFKDEVDSWFDALYTIRTPDALIIHANDFWYAIKDGMAERLRDEIRKVPTKNVVYMAQTNTASGFPLNYVDYDKDEKRKLLTSIVNCRANHAVDNARKLGIAKVIGYGGFTKPFIKGREDYLQESIYSTSENIRNLFPESFNKDVQLLSFDPGQIYDFSTVQSFWNIDYQKLKEKSIQYYREYGVVDQCESYAGDKDASVTNVDEFLSRMIDFLTEYNRYVQQEIAGGMIDNSIVGKTLRFEFPDIGEAIAVRFCDGPVHTDDYTKNIRVKSSLMAKVMNGVIPFHDLYIGYLAEFSRRPKQTYNRDLVQSMLLYSLHYLKFIAQPAVKSAVARQVESPAELVADALG